MVTGEKLERNAGKLKSRYLETGKLRAEIIESRVELTKVEGRLWSAGNKDYVGG